MFSPIMILEIFMEQIERTYGDIRAVIEPSEALAYVERVSTEQGITFHLEADFYRETGNTESGFSKWQNEDSWRLQYLSDSGEISNALDLTFDEYEKINRFFMKYRSGTL